MNIKLHEKPDVQGVIQFGRVNDDKEIIVTEIEGDGEL